MQTDHVFTVKQYLAAARLIQAADNVEKRRLSRAVRADYA
jgi:hypothetical protein